MCGGNMGNSKWIIYKYINKSHLCSLLIDTFLDDFKIDASTTYKPLHYLGGFRVNF